MFLFIYAFIYQFLFDDKYFKIIYLGNPLFVKKSLYLFIDFLFDLIYFNLNFYSKKFALL